MSKVEKIIPQPAPPAPERTADDLIPHVLVYKSRAGAALCQGYTGPRHAVHAALKTLLSANRVTAIEDEVVLNTKVFSFTSGELEICDVVGAMAVERANALGIP